jgi:putative restriction endonuclease
MRAGQRLWTRDELMLAINLYCKTPFGRLHRRNPDVVRLSTLIGRTPSSVAYKLVNFASLDPSLTARGIRGAVNASKLDRMVWDEFYNNWDELPFESERLRAKLEGTSVTRINQLDESDLPKEGKDRERLVKIRVNQSFFRRAVLAAYNGACCITGLTSLELLIAGHIRPWSLDAKNRMNPCNGLALNSLHDRAFESGLIAVGQDYKLKISSRLKREENATLSAFFLNFENRPIRMPTRFLPDIQFLEYHLRERFQP